MSDDLEHLVHGHLDGHLDRFLAERPDRPFGNVDSMSGLVLQPFSIAGQQSARNLLTKARRALDGGDLDRATRLVDRAARLPYDQHEQAPPVAIVASLELFSEVVDALEVADPDDSRWLDAALAVLADSERESVRCELGQVLAAIEQDYTPNPSESAKIRLAVAGIPERPELRDLRLAPAELGDQVLAILAACRAYRTALDACGERDLAASGGPLLTPS